MAAVAAPPQQVALDRLTTYPIIKDSLSTGISLLKSNPYSTYALNTATTLSHSILVRISPVLPYKEKVGGIANTSLDFVEEKFPFVNTPTQDLVRYVRTPADNGVAIAREYADAIQTRLGPVFAQPVTFVGEQIDSYPFLAAYLHEPYQRVIQTQATLVVLQDRLVAVVARIPSNPAQVSEVAHLVYKEVEGITVYLAHTLQALPVQIQDAANPFVVALGDGVTHLREELARDIPLSEKAHKVAAYTREKLQPVIASIQDLINRAVTLGADAGGNAANNGPQADADAEAEAEAEAEAGIDNSF